MPKPHQDGGRHDDAGGGAGGPRGQLIHVATRCASLDEFVERFAAFAWEGSLVLPAASRLPIGTQGRFVIVLRDQSVAMRGRCRVTEARPAPTSRNTSAPPRYMLRVSLTEMDDASRDVHRRLIALRSAPVPLPIPPEPSETTQIEPARSGVPVPVPVPPIVSRPVPPPPVSLHQTMIGVGPLARIPGTPFPPPVPVPAPAPTARETRAPGAPDTLPANPLSELKADDLDSFIECTLLEADSDSAPHASGAPAPQPEMAAAAPVQPQRLAALLTPSRKKLLLRVAPLAACTIVGLVIGVALRGSPAKAPPVAAVAPHAARVPEPEIPAVAAKIEPPAPTSIGARETTPRAKPVAPVAAAAPPAPVLAAKPAPPPPAPAAKPAPPPAPTAKPTPPPAEAPKAAPAVAAADGACTARIVTEPKDAKVIWGGKMIGRSPIQKAAVPCGPTKVTLDRDRYQAVTLDVTADAGAVASVRHKLFRPRGTLFVTSTPPGAQVTFNRQPIGVTPKRIEVWRYEKLPIKVTLAGHAPWTKSVYLKEPETKVDVQLVRK